MVRPARASDVPAMSRVLVDSITQLCGADHHGDPERIAAWTANKTVEGIRAMLNNPDLTLFVAVRGGAVLAVGATTREGEISLNYVAPGARFSGVSKALLTHMESVLRSSGVKVAKLKSTSTARDFYRAQGWVSNTEPQPGRFVECYVMHKALDGG